ncbi:MAG: recJ, partial [Caulobacteraceae bacterium]|nr:recJ [Caulobacteraceae bacterium]
LAEELDALNVSRKDVEREVTEQAIASVEKADSRPGEAPAIVVSGEGWHPGVVGIVAGRLRERYRRPVVVIGVDAVVGVGKGSGRSQPGVNLGRAIQAAFETGLLMAGGGHAMAAGLTVRAGNIDGLRDFLQDRLVEESAAAAQQDVVEIDALVSPRGADRALYQDFQRLTPFGPGNPEPMFAAADVIIDYPQAMRGGHVRCVLTDGAGAKLKAIAWRAEDTDLGRRLLAGGGGVHVAGRLKADDWNGRQGVQLEIEDVADPRVSS